MFILILRSSVKSLQLVLNEFVLDANKSFTITAGAFTKARKKLKHTAFIELNDDIINIYYKDNNIKRIHGFRVLSFDGTKITLPMNNEIKHKFGSRAIGNQTRKDLGDYSRATYVACFDVLNNIAVKSVLGKCEAHELNLAEEMIESSNANDLLLFDRGYASYAFIARLIKNRRSFIIRCSKTSFLSARNMFDNESPTSMTMVIDLPDNYKIKLQELKLPTTLKVRLVKVILSTGEVEVLITSLLDENRFNEEDFKYLYFLRWGVETFFSKIKGRLGLENFTGKTVESIKQDFWSTIFMSNLEAMLTEDLEKELNNRAKYQENKPLKINKAVSYNVIKKLAFEIFFTEPDKDKVFDRLKQLFSMNLVLVRENRVVPRNSISDTQSLNFQKRVRKHVF